MRCWRGALDHVGVARRRSSVDLRCWRGALDHVGVARGRGGLLVRLVLVWVRVRLCGEVRLLWSLLLLLLLLL